VRVILADDDAFMMELLVAQLGALGIGEVVTALDGAAALAAIRDPVSGPQIVFCDLNMPGMDGLELIRHLAVRPTCHGVVLLSGEDRRILAGAQGLAQAHGVPVLGTLSKPVNAKDLWSALANIVQPGAASSNRGPHIDRGAAFEPTAEDLHRAITAGELILHYQPRIRLRDRAVRGVEGLVRWQHPRAGLVPPMKFVPLAEEAGLIGALTARVFEQGLADLGEWHRAGQRLELSLNASVDNLAQLDFPSALVAAADRAGAPLGHLIVEVTESRLSCHFERVLETLTRLRLLRVGLAIDDFGTGYSTMEQLRRMPFTELKIDRSFVNGARDDRTTRAILESSAALARELGMTSVAEGVETEDDLEMVERVRCDEAQGYLFARPMPKAELLAFIARPRTAGPLATSTTPAT
jgi:EAL domain-containing protein (putative c-di-GMP-specific phosphodiesterase class I)/DNA-binding NarL/FixJ family response regulator